MIDPICPCGKPLAVRQPWQFQARFCPACAKERRRAKHRRYRSSPRGKLVYGAWVERVRDRLRELDRLRARPRRSGVVVHCQTLLCRGTFLRTRYNGARKFCDPCRVLHRTATRMQIAWNTRRARQKELAVAA